MPLLYDNRGKEILGVVVADPVCGKDVCDECRYCLYCFDYDPCTEGGAHSWIVYEDELVNFLETHPGSHRADLED